jgi:UDP-glucose:(heptosyl)LPS alpha-1,3-glucosyltransferase
MMQKEIVFCIFKYFPYGGLQRDFLRIAKKCRSAGASIRVYATSWKGDKPDGFDVRIVRPGGLSNHGRTKRFARQVRELLEKEPADLIVGFNKMPGLDVYFAGDVCYAEEILSRSRLYRLLPRARTYLEMERNIFEAKSKTHILLISQNQVKDLQRHYGLELNRFTLLPPGLDENFQIPENREQERERISAEFRLRRDDFLLLHVGSAFKRKGVDRAIKAMAALPEAVRNRCSFLIAGEGKPARYKNMAKRFGLGESVRFIGVRQDIASLMAAADIMLHPARAESAGMILVEALASSLPVICTAACGYSSYIGKFLGGVVLGEPFDQKEFDEALAKMLNREHLENYRKSIKEFCSRNNLGGLPERAAQCILERVR